MNRHISHWHCGVALLALFTITAAPGLARGQVQAADSFEQSWRDLAAADAQLAYRAVWQFAKDPEPAVKLLADRLKPAPAPDLEQIRAWLADLSSPTYAVREKASKGLAAQEELAELELRKALQASPDLETRRRVELLLNKLEQAVTSPEGLRQIRAVEVLELLATPQATGLLQRLAAGYPAHRQTRQAQESLARLKQRDPVPEQWLAGAKSPQVPVNDVDPLPSGARARLGTTLFRHQGYGGDCFFSPDGRLVISRDTAAVYLWEAQTGKLRRRFEVGADMSLAVAPRSTLMALGFGTYVTNGKKNIAGNKKAALACWDWEFGKELSRFDLPQGIVPVKLAFSSDCAKIIFSGTDNTLRAWDIKSGKATTLWEPGGGLEKLYDFSAEGRSVIVGSREDKFVLDVQTNQRHPLPRMKDYPDQNGSFSPDARYVAISSNYPADGFYLCDAATGKPLWRSGAGVGARVHSMRFLADGRVFAVGSYQQEITLWDVQTGKFLRSLAGSKDDTIGDISADGKWLVNAGKSLSVWNLQTGQRVEGSAGHSMPINGLLFSPRYDWIATYDSKEVHLWDPLTGKHKSAVDTGGTFTRGAAVSPDGRWLAAAHPGPGEGFLKLWDTATGRQVYKLPGHAVRNFGRYADVRFSPDGRFLLSWGDNYMLRKWDVKTGKALMEVQTQPRGLDYMEEKFSVRSVEYGWTSQFDRFFVLDAGGQLHSFDVNTGKEGPLVKIRAASYVGACAFSPTGDHVGFVGKGSEIAVYTATTGKLTFEVQMPARPGRLTFSPDGRSLAAVADDKCVVIEVATGKVRLTFSAKAQALAFSPDGRFLAAAMPDTTALVWDLTLLADTGKN